MRELPSGLADALHDAGRHAPQQVAEAELLAQRLGFTQVGFGCGPFARHQRRPMGMGFARAFLTPRHFEATGLEPSAFWKELEARCAGAMADQLVATQDWAVLHFRRGGDRYDSASLASITSTEIGCTLASFA